jgi:hypothetical protein
MPESSKALIEREKLIRETVRRRQATSEDMNDA